MNDSVEPDSRTEHHAAQGARREAGKGPLIALVDDHDETRIVLRVVLEAAGYRVATASNGFEGLELIRSRGPDLVITDLIMPVLDGHQLVQALEESGDRVTPVILVSVHASSLSEVRGFSGKFNAVLPKPVQPSILVETVESLLARD